MSADGQWLLNCGSGVYTPDFSPGTRHLDSRASSTAQWVMQSTEDVQLPVLQSPDTDSASDEGLHADSPLKTQLRFLEERVDNYRKGHVKTVETLESWQCRIRIELQSLQSAQGQLLKEIQSVQSSQEQVRAKMNWLESHLGNVSADSKVERSQENGAGTKASGAHDQIPSDVESLRSVVVQMTSRIETLTSQYNDVAERMKALMTSAEKHTMEIDSLQTWTDQTTEVLKRAFGVVRDLDSRVSGRTKDDE